MTAFSKPVGLNVMKPTPIGRGSVGDVSPAIERAFDRVLSSSTSCADSGLKSKPPPMKPVKWVN